MTVFKTAYFNEEEAEDYRLGDKSVDLKTNLNFLLSHNGIRKGFLHTFIAPTGVGKSTLVRTIVTDLLFKSKASLLVWLTEESNEELKKGLSYGTVSNGKLMNCGTISEQDNLELTPNNIRVHIEEYLGMNKPDVLIVDNITTSKMYRGKLPSEQEEIAAWLKSLTRFGCAVFIVAHTNAEVTENHPRLIDANNIRGSKALTMITEFLYVLQPFTVGDKIFQFIRILKHRGQDVDGKIYKLNYSAAAKAFSSDVKVSFQEFVEVFKLRNQLK